MLPLTVQSLNGSSHTIHCHFHLYHILHYIISILFDVFFNLLLQQYFPFFFCLMSCKIVEIYIIKLKRTFSVRLCEIILSFIYLFIYVWYFNIQIWLQSEYTRQHLFFVFYILCLQVVSYLCALASRMDALS